MKTKFILIVISLLLTSCDLLLDATLNFDEETFETSYSLWKEANISNYEFTHSHFSSSSGPQPDIKVVVENKQFKSYTVIPDDISYHEDDLIIFKTIDEAYLKVITIVEDCKRDIEDSSNPMSGADITIEYNEELHIPTKINCLGIYEGDYIGGLSLTININDFIIN
jgi:hypothetical protein